MNASLRRALLALMALAGWLQSAAPADAQNPLGVSSLAGPALVALAPSGNAIPDLRTGVLNVIPDDALGFFIATSPLETKEEVEAVLKKLRVPFDEDEDYAEINEFLASLKGWDSKGTHAVALLPNDGPKAGEEIVIIPVTDYKAFAACIDADPDAEGPTKYTFKSGGSGWVAKKADYAALAKSTNLEGLQRFLDSKKSIAASCEPVKGYLAKHKTAVVVTPAGLKKVLDAAIEGLKSVGDIFPADNPQAESVKQVFGAYGKVLALVRDEATHIAISGTLNERVGADFSMQFVFKPDGKLASLSKEIAPLPPEAFAGLADDAYLFAGASMWPQGIADAATSFTMSMMNAMPKEKGLTPEQAKQLADAMRDSMKNVKRFSASMNFQGATFLSGMAAIYKVDDSAKFLADYEKSMATMSELGKKDKNFPVYTTERKKIEGLDALVFTTDMTPMLEQMEKQPGGDAAKMALEAMFGKETKIDAFLSAVNKETVVLTYDATTLKETVATAKAGKNGLADNVDMKKTAALLLPQPHAIGFMDVGGYVDLVKKIVGMMMAAQGAPGGGGLPFPIPPFPQSPPVGMAAKLTPQAVEFQLVVPMPLMENTRDYIQQVNTLVQGMFGR
jgi:hypothetical protein